MKKMVGFALQPARAAHDLKPTKLARGERHDGRTWNWRVIDVVMHVSRNKKIQAAVAVEVAKRRSRRPVAERHPCFLGNIGEGAIMIVAIQPVLAKIRYVEIGPSIIVVISYGNAETPSIVGYSCLLGDVSECAVVIVMKQRSVRRRGFAGQCIVSRSIHQINVEPAVVVVVEKGDTGADGLENEFRFRRAHHVPPVRQSSLLGNVLKNDGPTVDKSAGGDGTLLAVQHRCVRATR